MNIIIQASDQTHVVLFLSELYKNIVQAMHNIVMTLSGT